MGGCSSQNRSALRPYNNPFGNARAEGSLGKVQKNLYIGRTYRYRPSAPKLTNMNESIYENFSAKADKKTLSMSELCLCELPPHNDQTIESSMKIDAEDLPIEKETEDSITVTLDDNSTSFGNSAESYPSTRRIETKPNPSNQQTENVEFAVSTYFPPDIVDQVRKLGKMDNPEVQAVAKKLLDLIITKSPKLENRQKTPVAHMKSKSLDLNISNTENSVQITSQQKGNPYIHKWCTSRPVSVECEQIPQYESFRLSGSENGGSDIILNVSDDVSVTGETMVSPKGDEKMEGSSMDMVEFSKRQVIRSRSKSIMISEYLQNLPSLKVSLASNKRTSLERSSIKGDYAIPPDDQEDIDLQSLTSKIDELDIKITKSTQKLTELRRRSLKLVKDWSDSGDSVQNGKDDDIDQNGNESDDDHIGKNISFVSVEREINDWQNHKNNLVDERNQIIINMNRMLIDQITSSSPIDYNTKNEFSQERNAPTVKVNDIEMPSNFKSGSITSARNICLYEYSEEDVSG